MQKLSSLGVVIGRFQIHDLHRGHVSLLDHVNQRHEQMLVLIGRTSVRLNPADPFPADVRKQMLASRYPKAIIMSVLDSPISPDHWSGEVDKLVLGSSKSGEAILYGSRDSFIPLYSGQFPTEIVPETAGYSATDIRRSVADEYPDDPIFRLGWLAAIKAQFVVTDPTVDVAIHTPDFKQVLLGRRGVSAPLRFIGGFIDKTDQSAEAAAKRECAEEVKGIKTGEPVYVGSVRINDKRFRQSKYGIMTTFYAIEYQGGEAVGADDLPIVEWRNLDASLMEEMSPEHRKLLMLLLQHKEV